MFPLPHPIFTFFFTFLVVAVVVFHFFPCCGKRFDIQKSPFGFGIDVVSSGEMLFGAWVYKWLKCY